MRLRRTISASLWLTFALVGCVAVEPGDGVPQWQDAFVNCISLSASPPWADADLGVSVAIIASLTNNCGVAVPMRTPSCLQNVPPVSANVSLGGAYLHIGSSGESVSGIWEPCEVSSDHAGSVDRMTLATGDAAVTTFRWNGSISANGFLDWTGQIVPQGEWALVAPAEYTMTIRARSDIQTDADWAWETRSLVSFAKPTPIATK